MTRRTPTVQEDALVDDRDGGEPIIVGTPAWFAWLADSLTFLYTSAKGHFTARKERPSHGRGGWYWKAYRRREGRLRRVYLGASEDLSLDRLRQAAVALAQPAELEQNAAATRLPEQRTNPPSADASPVRVQPASGPDAPVHDGHHTRGKSLHARVAGVPTLHLQLLGEFRLCCGDALVTTLTLRMQVLLAYLALHCETPQPRQQLAFLFWPDATEAQARNNLRQLMHQLRHAWPAVDQYLAFDVSTVHWRAEAAIRVDVAAFEQAVRQADGAERNADQSASRLALQQAADLYRADLMPGCYDDWMAAERERLRQLYLRTLDRLIQLLEDERDYAMAVGFAQQRVRSDPLDEAAYRCLIRLHALNDDRASALRAYHACTTMLEQELAVEPSPATREVYEHLLRLESPVAIPHALTAAVPLVGRQREWAQMQAAWRQAVGGEVQLTLITGEAGIGKSRLAEELYTWVSQQGMVTARTRAYAAEGRLAYAPVADWLRSKPLLPAAARVETAWLTEVSRLLPELLTDRPDLPLPEPLTERWQRQRFFEALTRVVLGAPQPLLLLIDDIQWCDQETLEWLRYLLRRAAQARLLVVATARAEEVDAQHPVAALIAALHREGQVIEIPLGPLTATETAQLAVQVAGHDLDASLMAEVHRQTEGNPLFVVETIRAESRSKRWPAAVGGPQPMAGASPAIPPVSLPPKVYAVIAARLAQLSSPARELAAVAATIGRAFTLSLLSRASATCEDRLVRGLDELWQRRIVREQGTDAYDFSHDKLREVAYAECASAQRRLLHRRVAEALIAIHGADLDAVSAQIASHYEEAGLPSPALPYFERAAAVAQRIYANEEAITLLRRGLALLSALPPSRERDTRELALQTALGVSLVATRGYGAEEVIVVYERARELCQQLEQIPTPPVLRALAIASAARANLQQAHDLGNQLLSLAKRNQDPVLRVEAHYVLGVTLFWRGRFGLSRAHFEQALARYDPERLRAHLSLYTQDPKVICLCRLAVSLWYLGYPDEAVRHGEEALALAEALGHPFSQSYVLFWIALLHHFRRDLDGTMSAATAALALGHEHHLGFWLPQAVIVQGWVLAEQGSSEAGIQQMHEGLLAHRATGSEFVAPYYRALLAEQYGRLGKVEQGLALLAEALSAVERTGERWCEAELCRLQGELLLQGGAAAAIVEAALARACAIAQQQGARSLELRAALSLARFWQRQGRATQARQMLAEVCGRFPEGLTTPDGQAACGLLAEL